MSTTGPVLIAFDDSDDAQRAIERAGALLGDREAVVLTVWEPLLVTMSHHAMAFAGAGLIPEDDGDDETERQAMAVAEHGAELARAAGFSSVTARSAPESTNIGDRIVAAAEELDASVIVSGSRGLHGLRAMLGSVSRHVLERAHRPVLVVPGAAH